MSYTVELETLPADYEAMGSHHVEGLSVTTFAGGQKGRCVQISPHGSGFVQLDMSQLRRLRKVLKHAQRESLVSWPGAS